MVETPRIAVERYIALIEQLAEEVRESGKDYGWKAEVGRKLGVSPQYVSMIDSGHRDSVGLKAIESAVRELKLDRDFFYRELPHTPHYRDFLLGTERVERDDTTPRTVLAAIELLGDRISAKTVARARAIQWGDGAPTESGAIGILLDLEGQETGRRPASELKAADAETARAEDARIKAGLRKVAPKKKKGRAR